MKTVSEFQKILDEKLGGESEKVSLKQDFQRVSLETAPEYFFGTDLFKVQVFPKSTYKTKPTEPKVEIKIEISGNAQFEQKSELKVETSKIEIPKIETPRVKRNLTFDQNRAAKFFTTLGEPTDAFSSVEEIKSAYRKLAKRLHPDVGASAADAEKFKQLSLAYKLLIK